MKYFNSNEIAIVGCGYWGTNIVKTLESLNIKNIVCFDTNKQNLNVILKRFSHIKTVNNFKKILIDKSIKIVFLAIPSNKLYSYAEKCLLNNKHVFVEKPLSKVPEKINNLINISQKNRLKLMVGYVYIYNKYINYIYKYIIKKKILGNIKYIEFNRKNFGPIRKEISSLWDLASHDVSILNFLFKNIETKKIKFIQNKINNSKVSDIYNVNFYIKKIPVNINVSWLYPEKIRQINIIGDRKILLFDELNIKNPIKIYKIFDKYPSTKNLSIKVFKPQHKIEIVKPFLPKFKNVNPLEDEIKYYLNCVQHDRKIMTDGKFALKICLFLNKIKKS